MNQRQNSARLFLWGTGQHQEPIYVVDPQGRIVRTLHR